MTLLLIGNNKKHNYEVLSPDTFGLSTWGCTSQESLEKKRKYWYFTYYTAGNDCVDDIYEEYKANVLLETSDVDAIFKYIDEHNRDKVTEKKLKELFIKAVDDIEKIFKDWISIERYVLKY